MQEIYKKTKKNIEIFKGIAKENMRDNLDGRKMTAICQIIAEKDETWSTTESSTGMHQ